MILAGIIFAALGWLTSIWFYTLVGIGFLALGAIFVSKEEGLSAIPPLILTMAYGVGFLVGQLYVAEGSILDGLVYLFTGEN